MSIFFCLSSNCLERLKHYNSKTSQKQPFGEVLQNSCSWKLRNTHRKTPVLESFLINCRLEGLQLYKKRLQHRYFSVNIGKFLRIYFYKEHLWWLLLISEVSNRSYKRTSQHFFFIYFTMAQEIETIFFHYIWIGDLWIKVKHYAKNIF